MDLKGKTKHYRISELQRRHWEKVAKDSKISEKDVSNIFEQVITSAEKLPSLLQPHIPKEFPLDILEPILEGIRARLPQIRA